MSSDEFKLLKLEEKLCLTHQSMRPFCVDFLSETLQKRARAYQHEWIVKACKPKANMRILDISAGFGRDAFMLAQSGADILMLERHEIVSRLLEDGLRRLKDMHSELKLALLVTDSYTYLQQLDINEYPDLIYYDPMHPERKKSSKVKKDLQILQNLVSADDNKEALARLARSKCRKKLVIKWPRKSAPLLASPTYSIGDKHKATVRFDVYTPILP